MFLMVIIFSVLHGHFMQGNGHQWYQCLTIDQQICNFR